MTTDLVQATDKALYNGAWKGEFVLALLDHMLENGEIDHETYELRVEQYTKQLDGVRQEISSRDLPQPATPPIKFKSPKKKNKPPPNIIHVKTAIMGSKTK